MRSRLRLQVFPLFAMVMGLLVFAPAAGAILSKSEEREIGRKVLDEVRQVFRLLEDPYLLAYLDGVGRRLVKAADLRAFDPDFHIVADSRINAFAVPGGHVFVTSETLLRCQDESELAGVIAHELGHVEGRHIAHRLEASSRVNLAALAAVLAGVFLARSPQAGAAVTSFALAGAQTKMLQYSRTDEEDSDRRALRTLEAAGYDGWGLVRFMETIRRQSPAPEGVPAYLFTHPLPENRSTYLAQALEGRPPPPRDPARLGALWRAQACVLAEDPRPWGQGVLAQRAEENPDSPDAQLALGIGLKAAGRAGDARAALKRARELAPEDQGILEESASLLLRLGRPEEGLAELESQWAKGAISEAALRDLGWAYLEAEEGAKALAVYDDMAKRAEGGRRWEKLDYYRGLALGKAGREGEAHATLGDYFREAGNGDLSRWHYRQALRLLPPGSLRDRVAESLGGEPSKAL